jgi:hypothetical protein
MINLRHATSADLQLLRHWDEQPHVIFSDPNDDWMVTALRGTRIPTAKAVPVACWQSRQWQFPIKIGCDEHS